MRCIKLTFSCGNLLGRNKHTHKMGCFTAIVKMKKALNFQRFPCSDLVWIQTRNLLIRSQMLYSVELRGHSRFGSAKMHN